MKVMLCLPDFAGLGVQRIVTSLAQAWPRQRASLTLCVHQRSGPFLAAVPPDVAVIALADLAPDIPKLRVLARPLLHARAIAISRPHAVISTVPGDNLSLLALRLAGARSFGLAVSENIHVSSQLADYPLAFRLPYRALLPRWYPRADAVVCVADESADDLVESFGVPRRLIEVIPNPVDLREIRALGTEPFEHPWFAPPRAVPVLVGAGRLEPQKRFDRLLRAFARVRATRPLRLAILGEGVLRAELHALAARLGVAEDVWFAGFQKNPFQCLARADAFVLSSDYEGMPLVLAEAMALGTPVVSVACPSGPREMLAGGAAGVLVEALDDEALALGLRYCLEDAPACERRRAIATAHVERYAVGEIALRYLALAERIAR